VTAAIRQTRAAFGARFHPLDTTTAPEHPVHIRSYAMNPATPSTSMNSGGWVMFTYVQFAAAMLMSALGIFFLPVDLQVKGYLMMSYIFLIGATFTLAKTIRDEHEIKKLTSRIEDARTEKLLMEVGRA
jgi:hypothetical protein